MQLLNNMRPYVKGMTWGFLASFALVRGDWGGPAQDGGPA